MANVKITELTALTNPASSDVLPIVDVGADETKKVTIADLLENAGSGTASAAAFAFDGDADTGMYRTGANALGFTTGGTGRLFVDSSGRLGVGTGSMTERFEIKGSTSNERVRIENTTTGVAGLVILNANRRYDIQVNGSDLQIYDNTGSAERMRITGSTGDVLVGGSLPSSPNISLNANGSATFGARVTSNRSTDGYAFEADYNGSLRGGVYASSTGASLVLKDSGGTTKVSLDGSNGSATLAGLLTLEASGTPFRFGTGDRGGRINLYQVGSIVNAGIELEAVHSIASEVSFKTQGTRRITIDRNGNLLIGGTLPSSPNTNLSTDGSATFAGDIETTTAGDGVILKSPNGTRYRLTVANDGTLSTSAV